MIPERVVLRLYQAGFGEAQLLSFFYPDPLPDGRAERHVLIDFGSTNSPKGAKSGLMTRVAQQIREHTAGKLDAVVVTHRHKDHLSGFGVKAAAAVITELQPSLVVRPWTEDPTLPADATAPAIRAFEARLTARQNLAAEIHRVASHAEDADGHDLLAAAAAAQLPNRKAIEFLDKLAKRTDGEYLHAGDSTKLEQVVPGISVRVLGPPTVAQSDIVLRQRETDRDEFWMLQLRAAGRLQAGVPERPEGVPPGPVAWLVDRLTRQQLGTLMRVVRTVDDALNNTSLILLIDAGDRRMLFPGDAQIENWLWSLEHAPDKDELRALLADVDLYKVGHHGSRNATPRSLFKLWTDGATDPSRPMCAVMSTMCGVHGESDETAVPRETLVKALELRMPVFGRTDTLAADVPFTAVEAPTSGHVPFRLLTP